MLAEWSPGHRIKLILNTNLILKYQPRFEITEPHSEYFQVLDRALKILDEMPEEYKDVYARRMVSRIQNKARIPSLILRLQTHFELRSLILNSQITISL